MRTWLRYRGLLLANLALFVVFIGGMVLTGVRVTRIPGTMPPMPTPHGR